MKEIRMPVEWFNLQGLLEQTVQFLKEQVSPGVDPTFGIVWVQNPGEVPIFGPEEGWDVLAAIQEGKHVFFPFAHYYDDGILTCADGENYDLEIDKESDEHQFYIGMEDAAGYIIRVQDGYVTVNPAIDAGGACTAPPPSVELCDDLGPLEVPMTKYIAQFIKS